MFQVLECVSCVASWVGFMMAAHSTGSSDGEECSLKSDTQKSGDEVSLPVSDTTGINIREANEEDEVSSPVKAVEISDDKCSKGEKKWLTALKQFHNGRFLQILHLSPDTTEEDIKEALSFLDIKNVDISKVSNSAKVVLSEAQNCDPLLTPNFPTEIKGKVVTINHSSSENFLCVSNLHSDFSEEEFYSLAEKFGPLEKCFLIYCHEKDTSKGYGLIEYCSRTVACQARNLLHYKQLPLGTIHCDWLDHRLVTYSSLYSKCVFVDCLPSNFRDLSTLRKAFSCVAQPLYCQLGMINGQPIGFGIIEYNNPEDASQTQEKLNGTDFEGSKIKVFLTIPGVPAVKLLDRLITKLVNKKIHQKGLLPRPFLSPSLLQQIQLASLLKPQVMQPVRSLLSNSVQLPAGALQPNINIPSPYFPAVITQPPVMTPAGLSLNNGICSPLSLLLPKLCEQFPQFAHPQPLVNLQRQIQQNLLQQMQKQQLSARQGHKGTSFPSAVLPLNTNLNNQRHVQTQPLQATATTSVSQINEQLGSVYENLGKTQFQHFASQQQERTVDSAYLSNSQKSKDHGSSVLHSATKSHSVSDGNFPNQSDVEEKRSPIPRSHTSPIPRSHTSPIPRSHTSPIPRSHTSPIPRSHTSPSTNLVSSIYNNVISSSSGKFISGENYNKFSTFSNQNALGNMQLQKAQGNSSLNSPSFSLDEGSPSLFRPSFSPGSRMTQSPLPFRSSPKSTFYNRLQGVNENTVTPIGQKRKLHHLLPSPEVSPENGYIGQHSQGIGGHYADSYLYPKKHKSS